MKRIFALILAFTLLITVSVASAGGAGTADDPLVTVSYLNGTYKNSIKGELIEAASKGAAQQYDDALSTLAEIYDIAYMRAGGYSGFKLSDGKIGVALKKNNALTALTGATFMLTSGSGTVAINRGTVINISTGDEVKSGAALKLNQRYFCAENTQAKFKATSDAKCLIDGYYKSEYVSPITFTDVSNDQWFASQVYFCVDIGIIKGMTPTTFEPGSKMNMAQLVQILYRLAGNEDAAGEYWYSAAEKWAKDAGIITAQEFIPGGQVTRERFVAMFHDCCEYIGAYDMTLRADITDAADYNSLSEKYREEMSWAVATGLIKGATSDVLTLRPDATINRAEACTMIQRFYS